ncbi:sulfotransferase domain-containing protein [Rubellicoccus peritrichatus]|uniref:Sulfotransferase domain-containing protein n=1 Tax=Rubellicoccus peritrichatus TaxID=3080537 RepID=A0AAQ3QXJ1_9BACT|nr:sulfotransferase domain-containing protein [Puniceicoccus sp. CR14]WOO42915.1 sulfotransferase domain-containing protein [Puniceicoccus sp. CR14]
MKYINPRIQSTKRALLIKLGLQYPASIDPILRSDDVFFVSYPKSGNTYLRFLVASALTKKIMNFYSIEHVVPDIYQVTKRQLERIPSPRIMKSHELFRPDYSNVYYVVRDPRAVAMSYAYWSQRSKTDAEVMRDINKTLKAWVLRFDGFWNWNLHVDGWYRHCGLSSHGQRIEFGRYEDLIQNPHDFLDKVLAFMGVDYDRSSIDFAIEACSKGKMKQGELAAKPFFSSRQRAFVGTSKRPSFKDVASEETLHIFREKLGAMMSEFGYD